VYERTTTRRKHETRLRGSGGWSRSGVFQSARSCQFRRSSTSAHKLVSFGGSDSRSYSSDAAFGYVRLSGSACGSYASGDACLADGWAGLACSRAHSHVRGSRSSPRFAVHRSRCRVRSSSTVIGGVRGSYDEVRYRIPEADRRRSPHASNILACLSRG
jgi:hypothetical protein